MAISIVILLLITVAILYYEHRIHLTNLARIPYRIHVNGTRGKSSVTRLIAGALREHGYVTFAKTTGTLPRMIMDDGKEYPVYRPRGANIIEQLRIVSFAAHHGADILVIECMALQPYLQWLTEHMIVRATHGLITNARADHLDVMGPGERDVALALLGSTPYQGKLFTAERDWLPEFRLASEARGTELLNVTEEEIEAVTDKEMAGFHYVEHKENVALVLKVCEDFGVSREVALRGMYKAARDPGAMSEHEVEFFGHHVMFVNGFAANDPESSERIWRMALDRNSNFTTKIMILNMRADRPDRSRQLGEALAAWPPADKYILIGSGAYVLMKYAAAKGVDPNRFVYAEGLSADRIFEEVIGHAGRSALVMGIGNIGGPGLDVVRYFRNRSTV